ncbi:MAG: polysaccharide deacetylase family protein [Deltaproteobacteria bacterium]|nr:polysaccharide deacetylase family protein [Deltaproteobacteria bacterium]MBW2305857.1 polysaccharide deacetylase family protein [Deltaproteobacteria bacterium]
MISVPILTYHGIDARPRGVPVSQLFVPPEQFRKHVKTLVLRGYESLRMSELADCLQDGVKAPGKRVVFTFDDGFRDNYEHVLPLLTLHGCVGTFFVVVHRIGGIGEWSPKTAGPLLTWNQIQEMYRAGMEIGSHTLTHPDLTRRRRVERRKELVDSRKILEDKLGAPVHSFCYPFGEFNEEVEREVQEAGYTSACTVMRGNRHGRRDLFRIKRIPMHQRNGLLRLIYRTSVFYHWEHLIKKWLI